jgi:hypothetical protein
MKTAVELWDKVKEMDNTESIVKYLHSQNTDV